METSTTITPQPGITTIPLADSVPATELVFPESGPFSVKAQQSYVLIAHGETTEEALAEAGFVAKTDGPLQ